MELHKPLEALAEYGATLLNEPNRYRAIAGAMRAAGAGFRARPKALTG